MAKYPVMVAIQTGNIRQLVRFDFPFLHEAESFNKAALLAERVQYTERLWLTGNDPECISTAGRAALEDKTGITADEKGETA